ncbi:hypothetical protein EPN44_04765 [bacterium]|nr:MAG: hypothetical protein EPN44_04765 [bacterium]
MRRSSIARSSVYPRKRRSAPPRTPPRSAPRLARHSYVARVPRSRERRGVCIIQTVARSYRMVS